MSTSGEKKKKPANKKKKKKKKNIETTDELDGEEKENTFADSGKTEESAGTHSQLQVEKLHRFPDNFQSSKVSGNF